MFGRLEERQWFLLGDLAGIGRTDRRGVDGRCCSPWFPCSPKQGTAFGLPAYRREPVGGRFRREHQPGPLPGARQHVASLVLWRFLRSPHRRSTARVRPQAGFIGLATAIRQLDPGGTSRRCTVRLLRGHQARRRDRHWPVPVRGIDRTDRNPDSLRCAAAALIAAAVGVVAWVGHLTIAGFRTTTQGLPYFITLAAGRRASACDHRRPMAPYRLLHSVLAVLSPSSWQRSSVMGFRPPSPCHGSAATTKVTSRDSSTTSILRRASHRLRYVRAGARRRRVALTPATRSAGSSKRRRRKRGAHRALRLAVNKLATPSSQFRRSRPCRTSSRSRRRCRLRRPKAAPVDVHLQAARYRR